MYGRVVGRIRAEPWVRRSEQIFGWAWKKALAQVPYIVFHVFLKWKKKRKLCHLLCSIFLSLQVRFERCGNINLTLVTNLDCKIRINRAALGIISTREIDYYGRTFIPDIPEFQTELFNIPDWDCPDTVKGPFYKGLERN